MNNIIVAFNENFVIGNKGKIPWHIPADLRRFKKLTMGHSVIMGRKTHESIGKLLKGRVNIIVSRNRNYIPLDVSESCFVVTSLAAAIETAYRENLKKETNEIFIIGGSEIYQQAMPFIERIYATYVEDESTGDAFFPVLNPAEWNLTLLKEKKGYEFATLERKR